MKSEGVRDVVKWLENRCKELKIEMENDKREASSFSIDNEYADFLDREAAVSEAKFHLMVSTKISIEKYMKKLIHEEKGESNYE